MWNLNSCKANKRFGYFIAVALLAGHSNIALGASNVIEEVVVTATKRSQSISEVAGSISAITADAIEDRSITNIEDVQGMVPNLNFRDQHGSRLITIRGIGGNIETGVVETGVAAHLDGVYLPRADILAVDFNDLERVEVLRGPQGTLYGKNATGGTVNLISKAPTEEFEGRISIGGGSFGAQRASAMISGAIGDRVAGRFSAFYADDDGFADNIVTGNDIGGAERVGVRGALAIQLADNWSVTLAAFHQESEFVGTVQGTFDAAGQVFPNLVTAFFGATHTNTDEFYEVAQLFDPENELETTGGTLRIEGALTDTISVTSITGLIDHTQGPQFYGFGGILSDGFLTPGGVNQFGTIGRTDAKRVQGSESFSQELNLSGVTADGTVDWLVGLYYFQEDFNATIPFAFTDLNVQALVGGNFTFQDPVIFPAGTLFFGNNQEIEEDNSNMAAFFDVTWSFAEDWRLNLGGRFFDEEKNTVQTLQTILTLPPGALLMPTGGTFILPICPPNNEVDLDEDGFSPKIRLEWNVSEDQLAYVQYQEGQKSGQVNLSLCNDVVEPEEIESWELGYKATFAEGRGTFNVSAFRYDYTDFQTLEFTPDGTSAYLTNVPESEITGAEVEFAYAFSDALSVDAAITWLDSKITKGSDQIGVDTANLAAGIQDLEGNPLPSTPEYTFLAAIDYAIPFDGGSLTTRIEYQYTDEHAFRLFDVMEVHPADGQDSYDLLNLYATLSFDDDRYQIRGFLRNATDEEYKYWTLYSLSTSWSGSYAPPRTWGIDLTMNF
ncbi:MAG: TonB-dependent receptor [Gammaproteobacteria bacterium]|nr:TonB-dependent receptor [Gammaproteobacteria bacterium]